MRTRSNKESLILLAGDILFFVAALWVTLIARYRELPDLHLWISHLVPFGFLFAIWIVVFFIFDLYSNQRAAFRRRLFAIILRAQVFNSIIAVLVFYFVPIAGIAPKTTLFLNLFFSFALIVAWRLFLVNLVYRGKTSKALLLGTGPDIDSLRVELKSNEKYRLNLQEGSSLAEFIKKGTGTVIADFHSEKTEAHRIPFYSAVLRGVQFVDVRYLYEQIFDKVPLSLLDQGWFLENISGRSKFAYDVLKRGMDLCIALPAGLVSLIFYPFVALAITIEDGGSVFITQERVGKNGETMRITKFRSMSASESGSDVLKSKARVTRVGKFLRTSRIDELPQLWDVVRGDLSLVGPRPELPALAEVYRTEIPYYDIRHIIKPGLSGWAQIYHEEHPHHGTAVKQTEEKLSYDLFYVKNRSFVLDLKIALKTLKTLLMRVGV